MYKYSCRKCPIRNRCIDESNNADSIKVMIRRAFEARTDTLATWGRLQKDCLLVKAEEEKKAKTSPLSLRLQQAKATRDEAAAEISTAEEGVNTDEATASGLGRIRESKDRHKQSQPPDYLQPVAPTDKRPAKPLKRLTTRVRHGETVEFPELYWFTLQESKRHIILPPHGLLVFGRFDPNVGIPPDIDLAYEDKEAHYISRRHASVVGKNSRHTVEDLGSKSGIYLNGTKIGYGPSRELEPGDSLRLGSVNLVYDRMPPSIFQKIRSGMARHILYVTPTGRKVVIKPPKSMVIGRTDARVNFVPDIDLSRDGAVTRLVSRRHALIQWRNGQPYLEDLGSGFGTRIRGELLALGQSIPLLPGDHIWLAGCVLAYDIEM